jgi:hypothetical protein
MRSEPTLTGPRESAPSDVDATSNGYFTVGAVKFALMSATTFGFYQLYWFYRNWRIIRDHEQSEISPFWRAFFAPVWTFSMGKHFTEQAKRRNLLLTLPVSALGVAYMLMNVIWRLPDPYALGAFLSFMPLLPFDRAARRLNGNGELAAPTHGRYSGWNIAWLIFGSLLFVLAVIASFLPESSA